MGWLANLFRKEESLDPQVKWLTTVDSAYQRAFQVKNVAGLEKYMTKPCLARVLERIRLDEPINEGIQRYMHVSWNMEGASDDNDVWVKTVTYDHVNFSHGVVLPVGSDYTEKWVILIDRATNLVSDIRRIL